MMLSLSQAAERAGLSPQTCYHWIWRHRNGLALHPEGQSFCAMLKQIGRSLKVDETDLRDWLAKCGGKVRSKHRSSDSSEEIQALTILAGKLEEQHPGEARMLRAVAENLIQKAQAIEQIAA